MEQVRDVLYRAVESLDQDPKAKDQKLIKDIDAVLKKIDNDFCTVYYP